ncbi:MAG: class I SAM-dependent methyltransferase [Candidatus Saccharibacteria bacterium]
MIPDQTAIWNKKHSLGEHEGLRHAPSSLAVLVEAELARESHILELGCGVGGDTVFFAEKSHTVVATDASEVVIEQNKKHFKDSTVDFLVLDMQQPLPYSEGFFDTVFANLSLHYYSHTKTREIVEEIARVLKPNGIFAFACKSVDDIHHGVGEEVEKDIFVSPSGHVRHLFTIPYTKELLGDLFSIELVDTIGEEYNKVQSNILRCIARKVGE